MRSFNGCSWLRLSCHPAHPAAAEIRDDLACRVMARGPGDAATGVRPGAAHVESAKRPAIVAIAEHGARREQLIEAQYPMHDVAVHQAEGALEVERTHDLAPEHARLEVRC